MQNNMPATAVQFAVQISTGISSGWFLFQSSGVESLHHVFVPATGQSTLGEIYQTIRWPKPFALATKFRTKYSVIPGFDGASETGRSARLRIRDHSRLIQDIIKTKKTYNLDKKTLSVAI